ILVLIIILIIIGWGWGWGGRGWGGLDGWGWHDHRSAAPAHVAGSANTSAAITPGAIGSSGAANAPAR
ncbi:MAG: hypothetical protein ACRECE_01475, partial [Xanthobacteraceae bacterium]